MNFTEEDAKFLEGIGVQPNLDAEFRPETKLPSDTDFLKNIGINPNTKLSLLNRIRWTRRKISERIVVDPEGRMLAKEVLGDFLWLSAGLLFVSTTLIYVIAAGWWPMEVFWINVLAALIAWGIPCMMLLLKFLDLRLSYYRLKAFYNTWHQKGSYRENRC